MKEVVMVTFSAEMMTTSVVSKKYIRGNHNAYLLAGKYVV